VELVLHALIAPLANIELRALGRLQELACLAHFARLPARTTKAVLEQIVEIACRAQERLPRGFSSRAVPELTGELPVHALAKLGCIA